MKMAAPELLNVYLLTFNCGREYINAEAFAPHLFDALKSSPAQQATTVTGHITLPDVLVLNLQEVAPIAYSFLGGSFLSPYFDLFRQMVNHAADDALTNADHRDEASGYVNILTRNVGLTAIMIFIRTDLVSRINGIMTAGVGVGIHETGHKGAVGARINWRLDNHHNTSNGERNDNALDLTFVAAHLAPMEDALQRRHEDFKNITKGLVFTADTESLPVQGSVTRPTAPASDAENTETEPLLSNSTTGPAASLIGMYTSPSYLFFAGDLNYRTSDTAPSKSDVSSFPQLNVTSTHPNHISRLLPHDQLTAALNKGETLHGLSEQPITFPPTYKYNYSLGGATPSQKPIIAETDVKSWSWASHRWPSWCDRILFFQPQGSQSPSRLIPGTYTALPMLTTSDHRPVALFVQVPLVPMTASVGVQLTQSAPVAIDPGWKARRDAARRREIIVGLASYLGLTREGNTLVFGGLATVVGGLLIARMYGA